MTHGPASVSLLGLAIPGQLGGVRCAENLVSRVPFSTGPAVGQVVPSSRRASRSHAPGGQCVSCDQTHVPFMASILCPYILCVFSCVPEIFCNRELEYGGRDSNSSLLVCTVFGGCERAGFSTFAGLQSLWSFLSQR